MRSSNYFAQLEARSRLGSRKMVLALILLAAISAGCSKAQQKPVQAVNLPPAEKAYVAPQSAPVLPPTYPSLAGDVVQTGTASIPIIQGR